MSLGPTEVIVLLLIVLLLFGGTKLPKLARSLGEAKKEFEKGTAGDGSTASAEKPEKSAAKDGDDA